MHNGKEKHKSHRVRWLEEGAGSRHRGVVFSPAADPARGLVPCFSGPQFLLSIMWQGNYYSQKTLSG